MSLVSGGRPVQLPLGIQLRDSASLESFFVGPNAELLGQLERVADEASVASMHFLHGPQACGKTHLLQAVSRAAGERGQATAYVPLAELANSDPATIEGFARLALVCLDDVQAIAGRRDWEHALMALCDGLRAANAVVLAAGTRPPMESGLGLKDLATRLAWGPVYALKPLDDAHKLQLLQQRARSRGLELPEEAGRFLLTRHTREIPALLGLLDRLDRASLAAQRRLTLPFVREVLEARL